MADDPIDAFDQLADDIRRTQDELDAADRLRSDGEAERAERKKKAPSAADAEPPETK